VGHAVHITRYGRQFREWFCVRVVTIGDYILFFIDGILGIQES
jgi:hypothetical protein